jgi:hypothetical protein
MNPGISPLGSFRKTDRPREQNRARKKADTL